MAAANELLGTSLLPRPKLLRSSFLGSEHVYLITSASHKRIRSSSTRPPVLAAISERLAVIVPEKPVKFKVRVSVTVRWNRKTDVKERIAHHMDALADKIGIGRVGLQIISTEIDPRTSKPKRSIEAVLRDWFEKSREKGEKAVYTAELTVDSSFGSVGAIAVKNNHQREFFLEGIVIEGFLTGAVYFNCRSWVQPYKDQPVRRIFFADKPYLPSETPSGLKELREKELRLLRGDGTGERKMTDRIYDYDLYNDLGNPDKGRPRPTLGGKRIPYPRRCRTGRPATSFDPTAESRVEAPLPLYVPRDEAFEELKQDMLDAGERKAKLHVLVPSLVATSEECHDFDGFHEMDGLYKATVRAKDGLQAHLLNKIPFMSKIQEADALLKYDTPGILTKDRFAWIRDDEFARQTIAGINPVSIERVKEFPPTSKLDPEIYGPVKSSIREEHIVGHLEGMTVQQALEEKKLFMLDYHDIFLPFLDRINSQPGRKAYATRTLFFLTSMGTLKPIAIELSLPPGTSNARAKRVLTPPVDATSTWLWQLAKAHVCSNDAGVHQLVNHWLRTHASMEPFILAAYRQLSAMHPIFKLLHPHLRYTLNINALARQILISGGGVIESFFTPGSVSMEMSAAVYATVYRFDQESLPADLIRRGVAEPDPTRPYGLKLLIEDYPYASDGLMIWMAIKNWVQTYVHTYYPDSATVQTDVELQSWYSEAINVGHADTRDAPWWPRLASADDLISILSTIIWLCSAQHASLNFAQYPLGGYMPNRPALMRRLVPDEGDPEYKSFMADPERFFLSALPSVLQATKLMTVIDTLSTHSEDEEYLGERGRESYTWSPEVAEAFNDFAAEVRRAEEEMGRRNQDPRLRNRCGAGVLPYELLMPSSGPGITCRGVPNSVTI